MLLETSMKVPSLSIWLLALCALGCGPAQSPQTAETAAEPEATSAKSAAATLQARSGSKLSGTATFTERDGTVTMVLEVRGVEPGEHAVHLHEVGDCSADDGTSAGGHWNPGGTDHGKWGEDPYHRGDIGNLSVGEDGTATLTFSAGEWSIGGDPGTDVVGRAVIVHASADDFTTQPTGAAGGRIGCGVIERAGAE